MAASKSHEERLPLRGAKVYSRNSVYGESRVHQGDVINITHNHSQPSGDDLDKLKRKALIESLTFDRMGSRLRNVSTALPKTCQWLFHQSQFQDWLNDDNIANHHGFLWIKGKPGSGKSTIMKAALNWSRKNLSKQVIISYFFNGRAPGNLEKSSIGLYRSIVHQILTALPATQAEFLFKFGDKEREGVVEGWTATELQEFLINIVGMADLARINIFVDALDEGHEDDVRDMVAFFDDLGFHSVSGNTKLRICLSSRHYPHITCRKSLSLVVEDQREHHQDIKRYVRNKLHGNDDLPTNRLRQSICRRSEGVFLWVVLVLPMLNETYDRGNLEATEEHFSRIPAKLDILFEEILAKSAENLNDCLSLLQWTLFSARPLTPVELYLAVRYSNEVAHRDEVQVPDERSCLRYLLHNSRGLIEQTTGSPTAMQFIHETVREYLLQRGGLTHVEPRLLQNVEGLSHEKLKNGCFEYFKQNWFKALEEDENGRFKKFSSAEQTAMITTWKMQLPFLNYAVNMLFVHADAAQRHQILQWRFLDVMSDEEKSYFAKWVNLWNCFKRRSKQMYSWHISPLYVFSEQNFVHLVQCLLDGNSDPNVRGGKYGYPLQAACVAGHEEVVRLLLSGGANVNAEGGKYLHAFSAAILCGRILIARLLQREGASLGTESLSSMFLDYFAKGSLELCDILLQSGADINYVDRNKSTALMVAIQNGNLSLFQWLIIRGAHIIVRTSEQGAALKALVQKHPDLSQWILTNTVKQLQATTEIEKRVEIPVDKGANLDSVNLSPEPDLCTASAHGLLTVVQFLLSLGADVNEGTNIEHIGHDSDANESIDIELDGYNSDYVEGLSALHIAAIRGNADLVKLLLRKGAFVDQIGSRPNTWNARSFRLMYGAGGPNWGGIQDLLAERCIYDTPLQAATRSGQADVAALLIANGARVNIRSYYKLNRFTFCFEHGTALHMASRFGHLDIVGILVENGADINAKAALEFDYTRRLDLLGSRESIILVPGSASRTALEIAMFYEYSDIVQFLQQHGAVSVAV